jgi:hypothetical protein
VIVSVSLLPAGYFGYLTWAGIYFGLAGKRAESTHRVESVHRFAAETSVGDLLHRGRGTKEE